MLTSIFAFIVSRVRKCMCRRKRLFISQRELSEFMRIEGITHVDVFPHINPINKRGGKNTL